MKSTREHIILTLILLLGISIRVFLFLGETFIGTDAASYVRLGENLIENGRYSFGENYNWGIFFPPWYPVLVGLVNIIIDDLFLSGKLISFLSSVVTIFLSYLIGKELHNKESGLFAALICAVYPPILATSAMVLTESLFVCLLSLSVYVSILSVRKNNFFIYAALGILIALSYLTRPEGLFLLFLPFLHLFSSDLTDKKKHLFKIFIVFLIFILLASPYLFFLKKSTGKFDLSGKSSYIVYLLEHGVTGPGLEFDKIRFALNEKKDRIKAFDEAYNISLSQSIIKAPVNFIKRYSNNIFIEIKALLKLLIPIVFPLFLSFLNRQLFKNTAVPYVLFPLIFLLLYPLFFIDKRQILLIIYPLILFSSIGFVSSSSGISTVFDFYSVKRNKVTLFLEKNIKLLIVVMAVLTSFGSMILSDRDEIPAEHVKAGIFLKNNITSEYEKLNIMSRMPWVSFYSDAKYTMIPYANYSDVINFAKLYRVDYIVIDERLLSNWDSYNELINMERYSDDVALVYKDKSGKLLKLYKLKWE